MQKERFKEIHMDADEFCILMHNVDSWERMKNLKFVEADVNGDKVKVKAMPVSSPGFYVWSEKGEEKLMVEVTSDIRIGYIDLRELAEFDKELFEELKYHVISVDNKEKGLNCRFFPKSSKSVKLFKNLVKSARWKKCPFG